MKSPAAALAALMLTTPSLAHAVDFSGHWIGTGRMTESNPFTGNKTTPCSKVELVIEHLPGRLTIERYHAICGMIDSDWGPTVMEIRDGKVYEDDEQTGTLEGDLLRTLERSGGVQYAFNLRLGVSAPGALPMLGTYYGVRNLAGAMVIEGDLAAQVPSD